MSVELPTVEKSDKPGKQIIKQLIGLVLALGFLWLAFRNTNFQELWAQMRTVEISWILFVCLIAIVGHVLRAFRWTIMLNPLAHKKVGVWNSFCAVMIGYAINIAIPRGGEVARVISISKSENLPWVGVLPTMLIDRLLDIAMLALLLGITLVLLPPEIKQTVGWLVPTGAILCVATVIGLGALPFAGQILTRIAEMPAVKGRLSEKHSGLVATIAKQFDQGTSSLRNPAGLGGIAILSLAIWATYFAAFYFGMFAFALQKQVDPVHALIIFTISSISVIVPTPGSLGTYHYAVTQAMQQISQVNPARAAAFATVIHAVTFVIVICVVAAICFIVQQAWQNVSAGGDSSAPNPTEKGDLNG